MLRYVEHLQTCWELSYGQPPRDGPPSFKLDVGLTIPHPKR